MKGEISLKQREGLTTQNAAKIDAETKIIATKRQGEGKEEESMLKYAKLISPHDMLSNHVTELVQGVIEGETRVLAASMTTKQIFKGTKEFKKEVFDKVELELNQFGLHIYNANVKQLDDVRGHEYVSYYYPF